MGGRRPAKKVEGVSTGYCETPEHLWEGKGPNRNENGSPRRDSTPSEVAHLRGVGQALATLHPPRYATDPEMT